MYQERILAVQNRLREQNLDAALFLSADPHASEYLPPHYKTRANLCGFFGSSGTLIIARERAWLLTDGRYFLQAEKDLRSSNVELVRHNDYLKFIKEHLNSQKIAVDFACIMMKSKAQLEGFCELINADLSKGIYDKEPLEFHRIFLKKYIRNHSKNIIENIRKELAQIQPNYQAHVISSLDDIAYICNLRSSDIACNPVFLSYFLITPTQAHLFCRKANLDPEAASYLELNGIYAHDYEDIQKHASTVCAQVICDFNKTSALLAEAFLGSSFCDAINPSSLLKAQKSELEIQDILKAHKEDGAALVRFYMQLEQKCLQNESICERDIDQMLRAERAKSSDYIGESFATIAGLDANSAMPHYRAPRQNSSILQPGSLLLIDSGAQYQSGTTDITRVSIIPGATSSSKIKQDYTMVLKAHINLASLIYKEGTPMAYLDVMARSKLWEFGLDYAHGTGHGVGNFLNVHEGPQSISINTPASAHSGAKRGMLTSIEPGVYHAGKYGIRLENLYFSLHEKSSEYGEFLSFYSATLFPFERSLIDCSMLNESEISWINRYHQRVLSELSPLLDDSERLWCEQKCKPLTKD